MYVMYKNYNKYEKYRVKESNVKWIKKELDTTRQSRRYAEKFEANGRHGDFF